MSIPQVSMIPVAKLRPSRRNARTHSKKQIGQIANSILRFGWAPRDAIAASSRSRS